MMREKLTDFIKQYPQRFTEANHPETKWGEPLVRIADADDPLFELLKTIVSASHALPQEIVPGAKSVITGFVPFADSIVKSNIPYEESSREWDYAYIETNNMLNNLSGDIHKLILNEGYDASDIPATYNYDPVALKSDWSHRSAAYIAGMGTFGINNMLITEKGCCGRLGSVITTISLKADRRPDEEYCLFKRLGICAACIKRCPAHAFTLDPGKAVKVQGSQLEYGGAAEYGVFYDRFRCNDQIYNGKIPHYEIGDGDTCGKCMVGLPCSTKKP